MTSLCQYLSFQGNLDEAHTLQQSTLTTFNQMYQDKGVSLAWAHGNLGIVQHRRRDYKGALWSRELSWDMFKSLNEKDVVP